MNQNKCPKSSLNFHNAVPKSNQVVGSTLVPLRRNCSRGLAGRRGLSDDAIVALARWRTGGRSVDIVAGLSSVGGLRRLEFDAVLLAVVTLVLALRSVVAVVLLALGRSLRVRWSRLAVVGLGVLEVLWSGGPSGAVEGLLACFAPTASCETTDMC